jgi:hypothetical protein
VGCEWGGYSTIKPEGTNNANSNHYSCLLVNQRQHYRLSPAEQQLFEELLDKADILKDLVNPYLIPIVWNIFRQKYVVRRKVVITTSSTKNGRHNE